MENIPLHLILPSFFAGLLMFLAPCTFPLIPGFIAFISGAASEKLIHKNEIKKFRKQIMVNAMMYVLGFTTIFILFGTFAGIFGMRIGGSTRVLFMRVGGLFVFLFGLSMLNIIRIPIFKNTQNLHLPRFLKPGMPFASYMLGTAFAVGWTPCVGPILASVLVLASTSGTVLSGAILLFVFSTGLAIPFLLFAWFVGATFSIQKKLLKHMNVIVNVGGLFLVMLGLLLLFNNMSWFMGLFFKLKLLSP